MHSVDIRSSLAVSLYIHQPGTFQLFNVCMHALAGCAHVLREPILSRETFIHFPSVFEQHGVSEFCAYGDLIAFKDKIGPAGPSVLRSDICAADKQVAIVKYLHFPQPLHRSILV